MTDDNQTGDGDVILTRASATAASTSVPVFKIRMAWWMRPNRSDRDGDGERSVTTRDINVQKNQTQSLHAFHSSASQHRLIWLKTCKKTIQTCKKTNQEITENVKTTVKDSKLNTNMQRGPTVWNNAENVWFKFKWLMIQIWK